MMNANPSRPGAPEPSLTRPEPRVPGGDPALACGARDGALRDRPIPKLRRQLHAPRCWVPHCDSAANCPRRKDLIVQGSVEGSITHTQSLHGRHRRHHRGKAIFGQRVIVIDGKVEGDLYATGSP